MDLQLKKLLRNILIYEDNLHTGNLWRNHIVRKVPNASIKIAINEEEWSRELNNQRESYSMIFVSWKSVNKNLKVKAILKDKHENDSFRIFSKLMHHKIYHNAKICVYFEKQEICDRGRLYLREHPNVYQIMVSHAPFGILEKLNKKFISRQVSHDQEDKSLIKIVELYEQGRFDEVLASLDEIPDSPVFIVKKMILKINCLYEKGEIEKSQALAESLLKYKIITPSILRASTKIYDHKGHAENAQASLKAMNSFYPNICETRLTKVEMARKSGDIEMLKKIILSEIEENSSIQKKCFSELISLCLEKREFIELVFLFSRKDFDCDEKTAQIIAKNALQLHRDRQTEIAIKLLNLIVPYYGQKKSWVPHFNLGSIYYSIGAFGEAVDAFSRSLSINPGSLPSTKGLYNSLVKARSTKKSYSILIFRHAIRSRVLYLNEKLNINLSESEENAFQVYNHISKIGTHISH